MGQVSVDCQFFDPSVVFMLKILLDVLLITYNFDPSAERAAERADVYPIFWSSEDVHLVVPSAVFTAHAWSPHILYSVASSLDRTALIKYMDVDDPLAAHFILPSVVSRAYILLSLDGMYRVDMSLVSVPAARIEPPVENVHFTLPATGGAGAGGAGAGGFLHVFV